MAEVWIQVLGFFILFAIVVSLGLVMWFGDPGDF